MYDLRFHQRLQLTNDFVIKYARELGFDLIGFTPADSLDSEKVHLKEWLNRGHHAGMNYMEKNQDKRSDVKLILPDARSVISLGMNYYNPISYSEDPDSGKISRYAQGKDYHLVIWEKLDLLISALKEDDPSFEAISYVDTGPVMDKAWAVRSGLGWMGKNTNIINKEIGSWFFIANIICNKYFTPSPKVDDFCGSCTACLIACPTGALDSYILDANKCTSYLTIENKAEIPAEFKEKFEKWIFGCDICQEVCPWNKKFSITTLIDEFTPENIELPLDDVSFMEQEEFSSRFHSSPVKRARLKGLQRNAAFLKK